jgi:hypothetical protein
MTQGCRPRVRTGGEWALLCGCLCLLVLAPACATAPQTRPAEPARDEAAAWLVGEYPPELAGDTHFVGAGKGADLAQARAAAQVALAAAVVGTSSGAALTLVLTPTAERTGTAGGAAVVLLAIDRAGLVAQIEAALAALVIDDPPEGAASAPERFRRHLARLRALTRRDALCQARARVGGEACPPMDRAPDAEAIRALGRLARLAPRFSAGVPIVPGQLPLRPLVIRASAAEETGAGRPWPALPLFVTAPPPGLASDRAVTDAAGNATFAFATPPARPQPIVVAIDRAALLGEEHQELWPSVTATVTLRPLAADSVRVLVHLRETVEGEGAPPAVAATALKRALAKKRVRLFEGGAPALPAEGPITSEAIIDATAGEVDIVIRGRIQCGFASRLAARSVWFEAAAVIEIFDLWTGRRIGELEAQVQEAGIGERHAAEKALVKVGAELAESVARLLEQQYPAPRS